MATKPQNTVVINHLSTMDRPSIFRKVQSLKDILIVHFAIFLANFVTALLLYPYLPDIIKIIIRTFRITLTKLVFSVHYLIPRGTVQAIPVYRIRVIKLPTREEFPDFLKSLE